MKAIRLTLSLIAVAAAFSCSKQDQIDFPEEGTVTKEFKDIELICADPSADYQWKENDQIEVFSMASTDTSSVFTFSERRDGKAVFTGNTVPSKTLVAIYPVNDVNSVYRDGNQYSVSASIPSVQAAGLCNNAYVAIGEFDSEITFKPVGRKVSITVNAPGAPADITGVTFGGLSNESVTGSLKMMLYPDADPVILSSTSTNSSVSYKSETQITSEATTFSCFVIPQELAGGYKVAANLTDGTSSVTKVEESSTIKDDGSSVISFEVLKVVFPDYFIEYDASEALAKTATCTEDVLYSYDAATGKGKIYFDTPRVPNLLLDGNTTITAVRIPGNVKTIGEQAFRGCVNMSSIVFEEGCESIELQGFQNTGVVSVVFPASLTTTGQGSFNNNSKLVSVSFAEGSKLTTIGQNMFSGCVAITAPITIPETVTTINQGAFNTKFTKKAVFHFLSGTPVAYSKNMFNAAYIDTIYVPASAVSAYTSAWTAVKAYIKAEE